MTFQLLKREAVSEKLCFVLQRLDQQQVLACTENIMERSLSLCATACIAEFYDSIGYDKE